MNLNFQKISWRKAQVYVEKMCDREAQWRKLIYTNCRYIRITLKAKIHLRNHRVFYKIIYVHDQEYQSLNPRFKFKEQESISVYCWKNERITQVFYKNLCIEYV